MEIQLPKKQILLILNDESELCLNNKDKVIQTLKLYSKILFGCNETNTPTVLFEAVYVVLTDRFINFTIQDLINSFKYSTIEKKQYVQLTRDEMLVPIKEYWHKKNITLNEYKKINLEEEKAIKSFNEGVEFEEESLAIYRKSLELGNWIGTIYNSSVIAQKYLNEKFNDNDKDLILEDSKNEYLRLKTLIDVKTEKGEILTAEELLFTPTKKHYMRIYSNFMVIKSINLKIKI